MRSSVFPLSGDGYLRELAELQKGCQVPFRVSWGNVEFLSRHCSGKEPHLALRGGSRGFSGVVVGSLGFLLSFDADLRDPLALPLRIQVIFRVTRELLVCSRVAASK